MPGPPAPLDTRLRGTAFLPLESRSAVNSPATTGMHFWSLNPYIGCEFGCSYCYARETHRWTEERKTAGGQDGKAAGVSDGLPPCRPADLPPFESRIYVKHALPEVLLRTLDPAKLGGQSLVIGTATDPYQPAERTFRVTRRTLEELARHRGLSIAIITKSPLVARDIPVLQRLAERNAVTVNLSLASVDAGVIRKLEPRSPLPLARLRGLGKLTAAGVHAGILVAPILPGISDDRESLAAVMIAARAAGAHFVVGFPLRLGSHINPQFLPVLEREFPDLVARYRRHYGRRDYVSKPYADALQERIRELQAEYGFPVTDGMRRRPGVEEEPAPTEQWALL